MGPRERDVIDIATRMLEQQTGIRTGFHIFGEDVDVSLKIEGNDLILNAQVRLFLSRTRLGMAINILNNMRGIPLLITEFVSPQLMNIIEENGINFIDASGNALINVPPIFIKIKGNKREEAIQNKATRRPLQSTNLQTIFTILCNPGIEGEPIREIAELAGVSHGTVHLTLKELGRQNYLKKHNEKYVLVNKENLLERWVTFYPERLKPKYLLGTYTVNSDLAESINLKSYDALWGGEMAAAQLTNYLRPFIYTIYIGERRGEFIIRNRLRKDPKGNLILMKKFWNFPNYNYQGITHPILVYADLLATGDPRNIETAKIIYEKEITRYIRED